MSSLDQLQTYLLGKPPGRFSETCTLEVESLLSSCWDQLAGSRDGGMAAYKLSGRTEGFEWKPPMLTFNMKDTGDL